MASFRDAADAPLDRGAPSPTDGRAAQRDPDARPGPRFKALTIGHANEDDDLDPAGRVWFDSRAAFDPRFDDTWPAEPVSGAAGQRPRLRLRPLIGATAVGVAGLLALFVLIGPDRTPQATASAAAQIGR